MVLGVGVPSDGAAQRVSLLGGNGGANAGGNVEFSEALARPDVGCNGGVRGAILMIAGRNGRVDESADDVAALNRSLYRTEGPILLAGHAYSLHHLEVVRKDGLIVSSVVPYYDDRQNFGVVGQFKFY